MRGILTPLAMAVFLAVMIDSFARVLVERVPRFPQDAWPCRPAIVLSIAMFGLIGLGGDRQRRRASWRRCANTPRA
jgi:predicted PurR-regulated permease PerM